MLRPDAHAPMPPAAPVVPVHAQENAPMHAAMWGRGAVQGHAPVQAPLAPRPMSGAAQRARRGWPCLALSLLAHAALLWPSSTPAPLQPAPPGSVLAVRVLPAAASLHAPDRPAPMAEATSASPQAQSEPSPAPTGATPEPAPLRGGAQARSPDPATALAGPPRDASPASDETRAPRSATPSTDGTSGKSPENAGQRAGESAAEHTPGEATADLAPPSADEVAPMPAGGLWVQELLPDGGGALQCLLQMRGHAGLASLRWRALSAPQSPGVLRYQMVLERSLGPHSPPIWRSEGRIGALGLMPERFEARKGTRAPSGLRFAQVDGELQNLQGEARDRLIPGVQDRLSWMLQLSALAQAWQRHHPAGLHAGLRLEIPVALLRGAVSAWRFEVLGQTPEGWWHLRRGALGAHDTQLEVWLDPSARHLPVRVVQHLKDDERWELHDCRPAP